ncbi:MAG: 4'-phosphopantetheinyl transferase superfamily protein, partial [Myxococcales bacterium]|nr:4'-phosphopantetheinyl transferase superfamily protein [Myxococcales bacterium]
TPFSVTVRRRGNAYDIDVDGLQAPLMRVRGYTMAEKGPLPPEKRFPEPQEDRPVAFPPVLAQASGAGFMAQVARADATDDVPAYLTYDERLELTQRGTLKRQADRIAGRVAAKRALSALTGVDPLDIRVLTAPSGEPIARVPGERDVRVSVSHRDGHAVAVAVRGARVGIDLEGVEPRSESFTSQWLSDGERALAGEDAVRTNLVWSAKEAVLKALGTGMAIAPRFVQVTALGDGTVDIALEGPALDRHRELGGGELLVRWERVGPEVCVQADLAA